MTQAWLQKVSAEYYNNYDSAVNVGRPGCREFLQNNITINDFADNFSRPGCRKFLQNIITFHDSADNFARPGYRKFLQHSITINDSADNFGRNLNLNNNQNLLQKIDFLHNFIFEINLIILFLQTFILRCFD